VRELLTNQIINSEQTQPDSTDLFAEFLLEIQDYFNWVMAEKLNWNVANVQITFGHGNVLLKFEQAGETFVFRVPKFGTFQIKNQRRAQAFFGEEAFFPDVVYFDGKCIIERFIEGEKLGRQTDGSDYFHLGQALAKIHQTPAQGFGHLTHANVGDEESALVYYQERLENGWALIEQKQLLTNDVLKRLQKETLLRLSKIDGLPKVVCHGDVWRENVIYNASTEQLKLIDWEGVGAFTREMDLAFLHRKYVTKEQRVRFLEGYNSSVDSSMVAFYSLLRIVVNFNRQHYSRFTQAAENFLTYSSDFLS
jgi:thiamine kinase-like enzyme